MASGLLLSVARQLKSVFLASEATSATSLQCVRTPPLKPGQQITPFFLSMRFQAQATLFFWTSAVTLTLLVPLTSRPSMTSARRVTFASKAQRQRRQRTPRRDTSAQLATIAPLVLSCPSRVHPATYNPPRAKCNAFAALLACTAPISR